MGAVPINDTTRQQGKYDLCFQFFSGGRSLTLLKKKHFLIFAIFFSRHISGGITTFVLLANYNQLRNQQWQSGSFSSINKPSSSFLSKA